MAGWLPKQLPYLFFPGECLRVQRSKTINLLPKIANLRRAVQISGELAIALLSWNESILKALEQSLSSDLNDHLTIKPNYWQ